MESAVFPKRYLSEGAQAFNSMFFFVIALQPNFTIRMRVSQSFEKRRRTVIVEINRADERHDGIISGR